MRHHILLYLVWIHKQWNAKVSHRPNSFQFHPEDEEEKSTSKFEIKQWNAKVSHHPNTFQFHPEDEEEKSTSKFEIKTIEYK